jgi:3-oxocholest-4-en-26-oyl-CoA dehydrogenase beta subunit
LETRPDPLLVAWQLDLRSAFAGTGGGAAATAVPPEVPDAVGGPGSLVALVTLAEEAGRAVATSPGLASLLRAAPVMRAVGQPDLAHAAATGSMAVAWADGGAVTARLQGTGWSLTGAVPLVPHAGAVEALLVPARVQAGDGVARGEGLFLVGTGTQGVEATRTTTLGTDDPRDITLRGATVDNELLLDDPGDPPATAAALGRARDRVLVVAAAELAGVAASALSLALAWVTEREQFGAPLGTLQAVQHRAADLHLDVTAMQLAVLDAAQQADAGRPIGVEAAMAAVTCIEGALRVTAGAQHLHGGEGFYADRPIGARYLRARALAPRLGPVATHLARVLHG